MQAVILAAGASTRFYPLSEENPKPMVFLLGQPILAYTISELAKKDIKDIILVVGKSKVIDDYFGDGKKFGVKISYVIQDEPLGMADGLLRAKELIKEDFFLLNGHHLDIGEFISAMVSQKRQADGVVLVQERENPWEYGVVFFDGKRITGLVEKPKKGEEKSHLCDCGVNLLSCEFIPYLEKIKASHYQLEEGLNQYCHDHKLTVVENKGAVITLKYPWDLFKIKNYLLEKTPQRISPLAKIGKNVILEGKIIIEEGAEILENAVIKGPAYVGRNALVGNNVLLRDGVVLEEESHIGAFSEVKNSLFLPQAHLGSGFVASSIIGPSCRLAHGFTTANRRFDRKVISVNVKGEKVETGLTDLGVIMGSGVYAGIGVGTMPGKTIGKGATIGPGTIVMEDVPSNKNYYVEFKSLKV